MGKIYILGDSNTFGYDPRSPLGEPYEETYCSLLGDLLSKDIYVDGLNGRSIADAYLSYHCLKTNLEAQDPSLLLILLGSNDILMDGLTSPEAIAGRMDALLQKIRKDFENLSILLLSPPRIRLPGFYGALPGLLSPFYKALAETHHGDFLDLSQMDLSLSYDGVHLSEEGHRQLGRILYLHLNEKNGSI